MIAAMLQIDPWTGDPTQPSSYLGEMTVAFLILLAVLLVLVGVFFLGRWYERRVNPRKPVAEEVLRRWPLTGEGRDP